MPGTEGTEARLAATAIVLTIVCWVSAAALFALPPPSRTLRFTDSDFVTLLGCRSGCSAGCRYTAPFNASAGEVAVPDFHYYFVWNDTVIGTWNGTAEMSSLGYAEQNACSGDLPIVQGTVPIPADGAYVVEAYSTVTAYVGSQAVNATVIIDGTLTIVNPKAYTLAEETLALSGGALLVAVLVAAWRSRPPAAEEDEATDHELVDEDDRPPESL